MKIKKIIYIVLGIFFIIVGAIGIILPILPTTPFLILSSFCFTKGSKKLNKWLLSNKLFGEYIQNYINYKSISRKHKIITLIFLWFTLFCTIIYMKKLHITIVLAIVGIGVTIHLNSLKKIKIYRSEPNITNDNK